MYDEKNPAVLYGRRVDGTTVRLLLLLDADDDLDATVLRAAFLGGVVGDRLCFTLAGKPALYS